MSSIHIWIVFIFSLLYIQCNERVKVLYILLCNIFNHMKKYKFQTDPSSEFQTRSSSELVSWDRTYFSKLDPVRNSELGAVWKMLPFKIMLKCSALGPHTGSHIPSVCLDLFPGKRNRFDHQWAHQSWTECDISMSESLFWVSWWDCDHHGRMSTSATNRVWHLGVWNSCSQGFCLSSW